MNHKHLFTPTILWGVKVNKKTWWFESREDMDSYLEDIGENENWDAPQPFKKCLSCGEIVKD